jgi:hypothetical protein
MAYDSDSYGWQLVRQAMELERQKAANKEAKKEAKKQVCKAKLERWKREIGQVEAGQQGHDGDVGRKKRWRCGSMKLSDGSILLGWPTW